MACNLRSFRSEAAKATKFKDSSTITLEHLSAVIGAEVKGIDLPRFKALFPEVREIAPCDRPEAEFVPRDRN